MVVVGLTGGIGSGKTTVGRLLAERGAVVIESDHVAREVVEPGRPALAAIAERFGRDLIGSDGRLDRAALAAIAFADDGSRRDLERITHPAIRDETLRRLDAVRSADPSALVVLDIPLLAEVGRDRYPLDAVLVVDAPVEVAVRRVVGSRGYDEEEARARVAAQASADERRAIADLVIDNSGDLAHLRSEVERAWAWIEGLRRVR